MDKIDPAFAIVFDVDGTLLDTREFIFQAYEHALSLCGHAIPGRKEISLNMGPPLEVLYKRFAPSGDIRKLCALHRAFQQDRPDLLVPYDGTSRALQVLREEGARLCVCSSRQVTLRSSLQRAGLAPFFESIIDGSQVAKHKPHPEGLLKALLPIKVSPSRAMMVGDTPVDIEAGRAAPMSLTVGITHGFGSRLQLRRAEPDHIVDSLLELVPIFRTWRRKAVSRRPQRIPGTEDVTA